MGDAKKDMIAEDGATTLVVEKKNHINATEVASPKGYKQTKVGVIPEEWEVVKFNEVFERITRKNTINNTNVLTISAQYGLINQEDFFNKSVASKDLSGYILLKKGEFAYNKSYSSGYPMGAFKRLNLYKEGVLSSLYIYFKIKQDDSKFYEQYFEAGLMNKEIYKIAQEGARNHGLLNMSVKEFFHDMQIIKPPLKEQQKIADILTNWDRAEKLKKGLMKKLLSGEVRFDGFDEKWEYKNADLLFKTISNKDHNSDLPILAISQDLGAVPRHMINYKITATEKSISGYKVIEKGDFIISLRSFQGGIEYSNYKGICSPAYIILRPYVTIEDVFYKYYFKTHEYIQQLNSKLEGIRDGKMISYKYFSEIKIPFPSIEEQQKIAQVLTRSDNEIELLKKKLETLKEQKRGLMQKLLTGEVRVRV